MITLTDGNKTVKLTKEEMELIEDGLYEVKYKRSPINEGKINTILSKLEGLKYE